MEQTVRVNNYPYNLHGEALASIISIDYKALTETNHFIGNDLETSYIP